MKWIAQEDVMVAESRKIITVLIILFALIGCDKKSTKPINLTKFLPLESNATKYIYKTTTINEVPNDGKMRSKDIYTEKIVTRKNDNCVYTDNYTLFDEQDISQMQDGLKQQIKDNKLKGGGTQLCADKEKIFYHDNTILYQHNEDWIMEIQSILASGQEETIQSQCSFISLSKL